MSIPARSLGIIRSVEGGRVERFVTRSGEVVEVSCRIDVPLLRDLGFSIPKEVPDDAEITFDGDEETGSDEKWLGMKYHLTFWWKPK